MKSMKIALRAAVLALVLLLSFTACAEKAPDLAALTPELEEVGITVKDSIAILSNDSPETQSAQWKYLTDNLGKTEHIKVRVTGQVLEHSVTAGHTENCYLYLCLPSADLESDGLHGLPVVLPKEILRAYIDEYGEPSSIGLFPNGFVLCVTGTLETYKEFKGRPSWNAPVLMVTELVPVETAEDV